MFCDEHLKVFAKLVAGDWLVISAQHQLCIVGVRPMAMQTLYDIQTTVWWFEKIWGGILDF